MIHAITQNVNWKAIEKKDREQAEATLRYKNWEQADAQRQRNTKILNAFLPQTIDERLGKLADRLTQAWPVFGRCGLGSADYSPLRLNDYDPGTVVRFFSCIEPTTFDPIGVVKHGAHWHLSAPVDGLTKFTNKQMQDYLIANDLNWVVIV